jgi:hypothetical protein
MVCSEVVCNLSREFGLIMIVMSGKPDAERTHLRGTAHGRRSHEAGVNASTEENSHRYVSTKLPSHGILEKSFEFFYETSLIGMLLPGQLRGLPVSPRTGCATAQIEGQCVSRLQFAVTLQNASVTGHITERKVAVEGFVIDAPR